MIYVKILEKIAELIDTLLGFIQFGVGFMVGVTVSMLLMYLFDKQLRDSLKEND